jgi:thiol-disulfide isomerase/thioredoxin
MPEKIILFTTPECGACQKQNEVLQAYAAKLNREIVINEVNVDKFPDRFGFIEVTPTWLVIQPDTPNQYFKYEGIIDEDDLLEMIVNESSSSFGRGRAVKRSRFGSQLINKLRKKARSGFGNAKPLMENINNLAFYGKNFPNGQGFNIPNSFYENIEDKWGAGGTALNAGIGGARSLGPGNAGKLFTNDYVNNIRMVPPGSTDDTFLSGNRYHAMLNNNNNNVYPGLVSDSKNPQIVDKNTGFGSRKRLSRFGSLYRQMGPPYGLKGNNYLVGPNTGRQLFSGAQQFEPPRPGGVNDPELYIGTAKLYNPLNRFGNKRKTTVKRKTMVKRKNKTRTKGMKLNDSDKKKSKKSVKVCVKVS